MTFTLTATPDTVSIPPRVLLEATESDSAKPIQSCQFYRDGVALRFSATVAGDTAVAYDYDAPFDVSLEYRADAVEADTIALDWTETWASLAAWTSAGGWSVGAGIATGVSTIGERRAERASSGTIAKVHGVNPTIASTHTNGYFHIRLKDASNAVVAQLTFGKSGQTISLAGTLGSPDSVSGVTPTTFDITVGADSVTASGSGWSLTTPFAGIAIKVELAVQELTLFGNTTTATIDDVSVYTFPDPPTVEVTASDTTSLTGITAAWLTNAAQPELAIQVTPDGSSDDHICFSPETLRETTAVSSSVALDIEGSPDTLTVVTGPRRNKVGSAELICLDTTARRLLETLLANNATIGIRFPALLDYMALDDGFYAVGDLTLNRVQNPWDTRDEVTMATLPLTPSRPPAFDVLWQWTYDALAQTGLTYDQVAATFATYTDLLIGPTT